MAKTTGGDKAARVLLQMGAALNNARTVRVGFLENATYPDGTPVAMIAAIQNFGAPRAGIPPRPFFSNMIRAKKAEWPKAIAGLLKANKYDAAKTLKLTGEAVSGQLRQSIADTNSPPLAPYTLARRGVPGMVYDPADPKTFRAKPLVDTGHMLGSVDYEVQT